jgi:hypothetical protein
MCTSFLPAVGASMKTSITILHCVSDTHSLTKSVAMAFGVGPLPSLGFEVVCKTLIQHKSTCQNKK